MKTAKDYLRKAADELDRTLAIGGLLLFVGLAIYVMATFTKPIQLLAPVLAILTCSGYLLTRRRLFPFAITSLDKLKASSWFYQLLNIIFFLLLAGSILSIYLSPEPYTRPLSYFISISLMTAVLAVEILFFADHRTRIYLALFKAILIGLSLVLSQLMIFPSMLGMDPWWHWAFTNEMVDAGHISEIGGQYSKMPLAHLMAGATMLLTGLNYKMAAMLSISLLQVVGDTLFIFLLGRFLFNTKVGLLAALLLGVATYHVRFGIWAIPNTLAATLLAPTIYLLFKTRREKPTLAISLTSILMAGLILTHSVTAMCLAILLFVFWVGFKIRGRLYREKMFATVTLGITALFTVAMFGYWMYISGHITALAKMIGEGFRREVPIYAEAAPYLTPIPFGEQLLSNIGPVLFFALSLAGCLYMVSKRFGSSYSFAAALGAITILALAYLPPITGFSIIEDRWAYMSTIMLAVPLGLALTLLVGISRGSLARGALLAIAVLGLSLLMVISPLSNLDNRTFYPNKMVRLAFTESEVQAAHTITNVWEGKVGSDGYYSHSFKSPDLNISEFKSIDDQLDRQDFSDARNSLILIRDEIVTQPFYMSGYTTRLDYDPRKVLSEQGFSEVYNCGSVAGFINLRGN